jgi:hypothetical protein
LGPFRPPWALLPFLLLLLIFLFILDALGPSWALLCPFSFSLSPLNFPIHFGPFWATLGPLGTWAPLPFVFLHSTFFLFCALLGPLGPPLAPLSFLIFIHTFGNLKLLPTPILTLTLTGPAFFLLGHHGISWAPIPFVLLPLYSFSFWTLLGPLGPSWALFDPLGPFCLVSFSS